MEPPRPHLAPGSLTSRRGDAPRSPPAAHLDAQPPRPPPPFYAPRRSRSPLPTPRAPTVHIGDATGRRDQKPPPSVARGSLPLRGRCRGVGHANGRGAEGVGSRTEREKERTGQGSGVRRRRRGRAARNPRERGVARAKRRRREERRRRERFRARVEGGGGRARARALDRLSTNIVAD